MMKLYYAQFSWYDTYDEKDNYENTLIVADSYADAIMKIENQFTYVEDVHIKEVCDNCHSIIYFPKDFKGITELLEANEY